MAVYGGAQPVHPVQLGLCAPLSPEFDQPAIPGRPLPIRRVRKQRLGVTVTANGLS
jgi:hypothetical protein